MNFALTDDPTISFTLSSPIVAYFNTTFSVSTSDGGVPIVTCSITCPDLAVSSVVIQTISNTTEIGVPVPGYSGSCEAIVEAAEYQTASSPIFAQNYTLCQDFRLNAPSIFSFGASASVQFDYPLNGPLGFLSLAYKVTPSSPSLAYDNFYGQILVGSDSQIFYQSSCDGSDVLEMSFIDSGEFNLTDPSACSLYPNNIAFQPYAPFSNFYWRQAQTPYTFTTSVNSYAPAEAAGTLDLNTATICLAANYILGSGSTTFLPGVVYYFSHYLGVAQSMSVPAMSNFTCGEYTYQTPFTLTNELTYNMLFTTPATAGDVCVLLLYTESGYIAPYKLFVTAIAPPPQIYFGLSNPLVAYFNSTFYVSTNDGGLPEVNCSIICPGAVFSVVSKMEDSP